MLVVYRMYDEADWLMIEYQVGLLLASLGVASYQDVRSRSVMDGVWICAIVGVCLIYTLSYVVGLDYDWFGAGLVAAVGIAVTLPVGIFFVKKKMLGEADVIALAFVVVAMPIFNGSALWISVWICLGLLLFVLIVSNYIKRRRIEMAIPFMPVLLGSVVMALIGLSVE